MPHRDTSVAIKQAIKIALNVTQWNTSVAINQAINRALNVTQGQKRSSSSICTIYWGMISTRKFQRGLDSITLHSITPLKFGVYMLQVNRLNYNSYVVIYSTWFKAIMLRITAKLEIVIIYHIIKANHYIWLN